MTSRETHPRTNKAPGLGEIERRCRRPSQRVVASRLTAGLPWSPESTINPATRQPYTPEAAWQDIANAVANASRWRKPPPNLLAAYALSLPSIEQREIYVALRLGHRVVIGESFCYLPTLSGE